MFLSFAFVYNLHVNKDSVGFNSNRQMRLGQGTSVNPSGKDVLYQVCLDW